jgi:hypothetical protein
MFDSGFGNLKDFRIVKDGYKLYPKVHPSWKTADRKLLVVLETVDRVDIFENTFLSESVDPDRGNYKNSMRNIIPKIMDAAWNQVNVYRGKEENPVENPFSLALVNFNATKTRDLETSEQASYNVIFAKRILALIERLKPTHILFSGATAYTSTLKLIDPSLVVSYSAVKRGWVERVKHNDLEFKVTHTLDLEPLYNPNTKKTEVSDDEEDLADKFALADLFYFVSRNVANLLNGKHMYSVKRVEIKPVYVDTMEKVDKLFDLLQSSKTIALDCETNNLETYHNKINVIQFAVSKDVGYVLPIQHVKSPFSLEDQEIILKRLRKFMYDWDPKNRKDFIVLNGKFDFRVIRGLLSIPVIYHRIWELNYAESLIDENVSLLSKSSAKVRAGTDYVLTSYQGLRNLCVLYENDFYYKAVLSKEERNTLGSIAPDDPEALLYEAADVQLPFAIAEQQQLLANNIRYRPSFQSEELVSYGKAFRLNLLHQMSNTVHGISTMEQNGSPLDVKYLKSLLGKDSPLRKQLREYREELEATPAVRKVEELIAGESGRKVSGIFGGKLVQKLFKLSKKDHQEYLFFDVLGLEPVRLTKTGKRAVDKAFIANYEHDHPEVKIFGLYSKVFKILSTYVVGWNKKMDSSLDSAADFCLRAAFGIVTTRRLCSFNPNLQQIPSRGPLAKIVKRAFAAPKGFLNIAYDLSAHEVRMWANQSGDNALAGAFRAGQELRQKWILTPTDEVKKELKQKGDIHIQNYYRFHKVWLDRATQGDARDGVKRVVFGAIYGKSAATLGKDLKLEKLDSLSAKRRELMKQIRAFKS